MDYVPILFLVTLAACSSSYGAPSTRDDGPEQLDDELDDSADDDEGAPNGDVPTGQPKAPVQKDPFAAAPAFTDAAPNERASDVHAKNAVGVVPDLHAKCLSCHGSDAPAFAFAGTIYADEKATAPGPDLELGIIDANGNTFFTHSDPDGNFWSLPKGAIAFPAYAAVRSASGEKPMKTKIAAADRLNCNTCHDAANPIHAP
jgi:hypothetical protein